MSLDVEEGKSVTKGDVLAVLETTDYEADVARAQATVRLQQERLRELENGNRPEEIKQAEAELGEAEATLAQLTAEFKRSTDLRRNNSITAQQYELAESQYKAMQQKVQRLTQALALMRLGERVERIEVAKAELAQAQADLVKSEWRLGNCTIRAPISGTILKKNAEEGNIVNPIAFNGSFSLCEMADLSDLEVALDIQERDISAIKVGQKCRVRAEAWPDRVYEGVVDRLMPIADRAKGAVPVRVKIAIPADEEGVYLKPEMGAIVTFLTVGPASDVGQASAVGQASSLPE
jgi:multidrug resistance efflux pump